MSAKESLDKIRWLAKKLGREVSLMEVCGTHTMSAFRAGLHSMLPENVRFLSGPGCPVCVTPSSYLDRAIALSGEPRVCLETFGDLMRVPGSGSSLEKRRAEGARVEVVFSPDDSLRNASRRTNERTVFLAVGFETTAPAVAWTVKKAAREGIRSFSIMSAHKTMPRAMAELLKGGEALIDGFLCPGHVSSIIGSAAYEFIAREYRRPCVIAGFEPFDMLKGIELLLSQIVEGRSEVENGYMRAVGVKGNERALSVLHEVFEECDAEWRGMGVIGRSGLRLRDEFRAHDAEVLFPAPPQPAETGNSLCICGDILRGVRVPSECPLFAGDCTPAAPQGACMVSSEGACAAYYRYGGRRLR